MLASETFSFSEISTHTSKDDCWLIIHGKVYDVSNFLEDHPGGYDILLQAAASGDATQSFEEVAHGSSATSMMEGFLIGSVHVDGLPEEKQARATDPFFANKPQKIKQATSSTTFMDNLLHLLTLALAFANWYYFTYINVNA